MQKHLQCLDTFRIESCAPAPSFHDCAILLEIWELGGLLQTNIAIPPQSGVQIPSIGHGIHAEVVSCQQDDYGFLVEIAINGDEWFPGHYTPPYLISEELSS
jgi:hypothetical protein